MYCGEVKGSGVDVHVQWRLVWMMSYFRQWRENVDENEDA